MISPSRSHFLPSKGNPPPGFIYRDAPCPEPSLTFLSESLVKELPSPGSADRASVERDACFQSLLLHLSESLHEQGLLMKMITHHFFKAPELRSPSIIHVPLTGPLWRYAYFQSLCVHYCQRTQWKSCPNSYLAADKKTLINVNNSSETWID